METESAHILPDSISVISSMGTEECAGTGKASPTAISMGHTSEFDADPVWHCTFMGMPPTNCIV